MRYGNTAMMPVPSHLKDCVNPKDAVVDESPLDAFVSCVCGSPQFELLFPGQTQEWDGKQIPCTAEINGTFFFLIKARCWTCKREHLLFDSHFHGWDGLIGHDPAQALLPRPSLVAWKCISCGNTKHEASVHISPVEREGFDSAPIERWPDAFEWFSMTIKCGSCGQDTPEWVSYETA